MLTKCPYCKRLVEYENHSCPEYNEIQRQYKEGEIDFRGKKIIATFDVTTDENGKRTITRVHPNSNTYRLKIIRLKNKQLRALVNEKQTDIETFAKILKIKSPKIYNEIAKDMVINKLKKS